MKTKLTITWKHPDEMKEHITTFRDINAESVAINHGFLFFANDENPDGWLFPINHVISMKQKEEK